MLLPVETTPNLGWQLRLGPLQCGYNAGCKPRLVRRPKLPKRWIQIDEEVFAELQRHAEPLVDDADSVIRKILGLDPSTHETGRAVIVEYPATAHAVTGESIQKAGSSQRRTVSRLESSAAKRRGSDRAPKGSLLPETEYVVPLLEVLADLGGAAPMSKAVELLEARLEGKLTETDRKPLNSGRIRWKNRVQFVRLALIKEGFMSKEAPRGIWEITDAGRAYVQQQGDRND